MIHPPPCDCGSYGCSLRAKGVQISPAATPTKARKGKPSEQRYNSWEKGKAGEKRKDGTFMPYLDAKGARIPIKKYSDARSKYDEQVRKARSTQLQ